MKKKLSFSRDHFYRSSRYRFYFSKLFSKSQSERKNDQFGQHFGHIVSDLNSPH
jgi:hypothetical protein